MGELLQFSEPQRFHLRGESHLRPTSPSFPETAHLRFIPLTTLVIMINIFIFLTRVPKIRAKTLAVLLYSRAVCSPLDSTHGYVCTSRLQGCGCNLDLSACPHLLSAPRLLHIRETPFLTALCRATRSLSWPHGPPSLSDPAVTPGPFSLILTHTRPTHKGPVCLEVGPFHHSVCPEKPRAPSAMAHAHPLTLFLVWWPHSALPSPWACPAWNSEAGAALDDAPG